MKINPVFSTIFWVTWLTVFQSCYSQDIEVVGPSDTVYVNPGDSASFNCSVTWGGGTGVMSIYWGISRDDGNLWKQIAQCFNIDSPCTFIDDSDIEYLVETNSPEFDFFQLTAKSPTLSEDGHYDCWPGDKGTPASPHARLYVLDKVDSVRINNYSNGQTKTVTAGEAETFTCEATSGNPPADLIWTIGDNDITNSSQIDAITETGTNTRLYDTTGSLLYTFNASDDQQNLECQSFQHESLTQMSWQILMNVLHAPVIQAIVQDSWEGNTVVVECLASANPDDITYSWTSEDGQSGGNTRLWELTDEDGDEEVTVTCTAANSEGTSSLTETVKRASTPPAPTSDTPTVYTSSDSTQTVNQGETVDLTCTTDASVPFPDETIWEWLQGDLTPVNTSSDMYEITPESGLENTTTLTIVGIQNTETYYCQLGESRANYSVIVSAPLTGASGCDTGCIIGISVGCAVVVLLIVILALWLFFRNRNSKEDDYGRTSSSNHKPTHRDTPADVEMTTAGMTTVPPPSDDVDSSDRGYDDRYDNDRYASAQRHRYDEPPEEYSPRYTDPPIDEGDGYPNYSNPSSPNYSSYDRRQQSPQLHYADLDLREPNRDYQPPQQDRTEYTTITPTIV